MGRIRVCIHGCAVDFYVDTWKIYYQSGDGIDWRKIVLNINMIAIFIGAVLFLLKIHLPVIVDDTLRAVGSTIGR